MGFIRVVGDLGVLGVRGERVLRWVLLAVGLTRLVLGYKILLAFLEK